MSINENAIKWVAALRSGEFAQTTGQLRDEKGYCCLGVGCELYRREVGGEWVDYTFDGASTALPWKVQEWLGLAYEFGSWNHHGGYEDLVALNDGGKSFDEIADVIESKPKGLFCDWGLEADILVGLY